MNIRMVPPERQLYPGDIVNPSYKRTRGEKQRDLIDIARLHVQGHRQVYIAHWLNENRAYDLSQQQVSDDLAEIMQQWRDEYLPDIDKMKAAELARLDALITEAWEGWERSKSAKETSESELATSNPVGSDKKYEETRSKHKQENRDGNYKFLEVIDKLISRRAKILGLEAPQRHEIKDWRKEAEAMGIDPAKTFEKLVQEEMKKLDE